MVKKLKIPIVDLKREYAFLKRDIDKQLRRCFLNHNWILGEKVVEFERKATKYLGIKFTVGVASGTDALILSLRALSLRLKKRGFFDKKDEIITTPLSFIATPEAIVRSGATPVFIDIDPDTFNIAPREIKKAITKDTVGILPVHLYGAPCQMDEILKIAKEYNLFVLEDCAQAFGGRYKGKRLGTLGELGAFSFFPSKNLGGYGDGGLIATNDRKLADLVKALRNHGQIEKHNATYIGYNSRLDSVQAAILLAKLKYIDKFNKLRTKIAQQYNKGLKGIKQIQTPKISNLSCIWHLYTIKVSFQRDKLLSYLNSQGIEARIYYPVLLNKMRAFKDCKIRGSLKNANEVSKKILSLPIHSFLKRNEIEYIIGAIKRFFRR
jgi:dTDP-4-amino-4,6-dideoxygalactose transaminase